MAKEIGGINKIDEKKIDIKINLRCFVITKYINNYFDILKKSYLSINFDNIKIQLDCILKKLEEYGIFILSKGNLEDYYISNKDDNENKYTHYIKEIEHILKTDKEKVTKEYEEIIEKFKYMIKIEGPDFIKPLMVMLSDWIHTA